ncbi:MAG: hypothetical protein FWC75_09530 [Oscillospiraceae bacterium]|nr:hypothetical protein [Oscillospiraceae bacterium]
MPKVPKAFIKNRTAKRILSHMADEFDFEEQQAIYYYCFLDVTITDIAKATELTEDHVLSVLSLYSERLSNKLSFLKKTLPHDAGDLSDVKEILLQEFTVDTI